MTRKEKRGSSLIKAFGLETEKDMERTVVYIVRRDSADGPENDVFLDYTLAREWAKHIGASVEEETEIDRETLNAMKEAQS